MKIQKTTAFEKYIFASIPIILILSVIYGGMCTLWAEAEISAPFVPINNSLWEILKILFYPILIVWAGAYFARYRLKISKPKLALGAAISAAVAPVTAAGMYYFYICALGIYSEMINFSIVVLSVIAGQFTAHHVCSCMYPSKTQAAAAFAAIIAMVMIVVLCTYNPPRLPIFMDPENGSYGINRLMD